MKSRFTTVDIIAVIPEIRERLIGLRVVNVYDIDNKTYLIRLAKPDVKEALLFESGCRLHCTDFEWPKHAMPSGFSIKLRKHLRGRRLVAVEQLGVDRIVDLQFGSDEAAYHVIIELYDRGNVVLTDHEYTILNLLRVRTDESQDVRFAVRERYPVESARQPESVLSLERLREILLGAKVGDQLKRILNPHLVYGPAVIEHCLLKQGLVDAKVGQNFDISTDLPKLVVALEEAEEILKETSSTLSKGFIIQKKEKKAVTSEEGQTELVTNVEYHPMLFKQHEQSLHIAFEKFGKAVDEFYSQAGSQKLDMKALQMEKTAIKKLENVKKDHEKRIQELQKTQDADMYKAQLIEINLPLVDKAIQVVRSAVANQIDWSEIWEIVKEAQTQGDPVAQSIKSLKLDKNHITLLLTDPFSDNDSDDDDDEGGNDGRKQKRSKGVKVDIDLDLSAYANARKYFEHKKHSGMKEQKTIDASEKALKSAEAKTKQTLKDVAIVTRINKARKTYWFEKFLWFISSENYLVIGGRDQQQNEVVVRKYLNKGDVYVHADLHGASSVIIKNPSGEAIPPKTLNEAGTMAICYSAAWDAKVVTSAWWVYHHQVSKTAPTGEYLTTGSFMVRGKKNYLPPSYLMMGFGFVFKVDDDDLWRHKDERKLKINEDDMSSIADSQTTGDEISIVDNDSDDEDDDNDDEENDGEEGRPSQTDDSQEVIQDSVKEGSVGKATDETETREEDEKIAEIKTEDKVEDVKDDVLNEDEDSDEGFYPDTTIQLQHIQGDKYQLQSAAAENQDDDEDVIYLGDDQPIPLKNTSQSEGASRPRLSAKQRREMKKQKKKSEDNGGQDDGDEVREYDQRHKKKQKGQQKQQQQTQQEQQPQPKRGQKAKLKKIKDKYRDQDEEERQLKMEILASSGSTNEGKGKKAKKKQQQQQQQQEKQQQQQQKKGKGGRPWSGMESSRERLQKIQIKDPGDSVVKAETTQQPPEDDGEASEEEKEAVLAEENIMQESGSVIDALTGCPHGDDTLLFAIPVCAPYNSMHNYKFKVKLTPGSSKRGKAAKTALNTFQFSRETTAREKDLFKSVKDNDLSRNLPGKVKVSAPNLLKMKKK